MKLYIYYSETNRLSERKMSDLYLSSSNQHCKLPPVTPANPQDISGGHGSIVIIQPCKKSKCQGAKNLEVRIYGEILRVL
jgi:hypothetical protein